jgi:glutamyl-tRNA reductase|tara:strand:+ start:19489 stop:20865 length:1377 start_codon:yes stop_codon:yes gene_type:complete
MFSLLGINHNTAPIEVREKVAFAPEEIASALTAASFELGAEGVAILSTCNRTEIYLDGSAIALPEVLNWLGDWHKLSLDQLSDCTYQQEDEDAALHLMRVASGLDSMVLGEPQILGQLKSAYAAAEQAGTLNSGLHQAFQHSFSSAKRVRSETAIGQNPVSVAYAAVSLARQIFADLKNKTALLIGAGETIGLVGRHLKEQGVERIIIANRTLARAEELAKSLGAEIILLSGIPSVLHEVDILFSSTASQLPLLGKGAVESALRRRKRRMMFMVDLAVPRDIEVEVGTLEDIYLYSVDDLHEVIKENRRSRKQAALEAETLIQECLQRWKQERSASGHSDLIRLYRGSAEVVRANELQKALAMLEAGQSAEEVVQRFSSNLTNKMLHHSTAQLKWVIQSGDLELIKLARKILGLDKMDTQNTSGEEKYSDLNTQNLPKDDLLENPLDKQFVDKDESSL